MKMKPYKIKSEIYFYPKADEIEIEMLFVCDREPNTVCGENPNCGACNMTKDVQRAKKFDLDE